MKRNTLPLRDHRQGKIPASSELARSNDIEGAVAEIIDAFEQARLVRISSDQPDVQKHMDRIKHSLTLSLRNLAPFAFHAERWLGEEVEQWP